MLRSRRLLIDTNLLVLFLVGTASRDYIGKHKRLNAFLPEDYDALLGIIDNASEVLVTPNILTETSNLAAYIAEPARGHILAVLQKIVLSNAEHYVPSEAAVRRPEFLRLGITDASIIELCSRDVTLITTDLDLYLAVESSGASALNYNHIREKYLN